MAINKVVYGNDTLIDLTEDDVTAEDVLSGKSFHLRSGVPARGALDLGDYMTYEANGILGAKNLCPTFSDITRYGVTFTVDSDGCVHVSGTATQQTEVPLTYTLKKGTYILSGAPSGSTSGSYDIYVQKGSPATTIARSYDGSNMTEFTLDADTSIRVNCRVPSGAMDTTKVFKPMIRLVSDTDDTYVPYAMTNRELTNRTTSWDDVANKPFSSVNTGLFSVNQSTGALELNGNRVKVLAVYKSYDSVEGLGVQGIRYGYKNSAGEDLVSQVHPLLHFMYQTANSATYVFSNEIITNDSMIDIYSSFDEDYDSSVVDENAHTLTVTFAEAKTRTVKVVIREL